MRRSREERYGLFEVLHCTATSSQPVILSLKSYKGSQCNKINQCKVFGLGAEVLIALSLDYLNYAEISDDCRRSGDASVMAD